MKGGDGRRLHINLVVASGKNNSTYFLTSFIFECNTTDASVLYGVTGRMGILYELSGYHSAFTYNHTMNLAFFFYLYKPRRATQFGQRRKNTYDNNNM